MTTDSSQKSIRVRVTKFLAVALSAMCIAVSVFVLAAYATGFFGLRISVANLSLSILLCAAGIALSVMAFCGRGTWKEIAGFAVPAVVAAIVALRFGMPGVYLAFFLGYALYLVYRWRQTRLPPITDET